MKDIINRYQVSTGHKIQWVLPSCAWIAPLIRRSYHPGWDCHGLPIENKALQELRVRSPFPSDVASNEYEIQKDALSLPPNVIRAAAKATAEREMKTQQEEFEQFCIMADWSPKTTFRTLGMTRDWYMATFWLTDLFLKTMTMKFVSFRSFNEWSTKVHDLLSPVIQLYHLLPIPRRSYLPALPTSTLLSLIAFRSCRSGARL